jgi:hypothetical protein
MIERIPAQMPGFLFTGENVNPYRTILVLAFGLGAQRSSMPHTILLPVAPRDREFSLKLRSRQSAPIEFALIVSAASGLSQTTGNHLPPPAQPTSEPDHQRMMDLVHIARLRRGADGDPKSSKCRELCCAL